MGANMDAEIAAAVQWWADQLTSMPSNDNGDPLTSMLGTLSAMSEEPPTAAEVGAFKSALATLIADKTPFSISVDYGPDWILSQALGAAGITNKMRLLPWKTHMWIKPGLVRVAKGYRAEPVTIFPAR